MFSKRFISTGLAALTLFSEYGAWAQAPQQVERPTQFVLLAFDGSYNNEVWEHSRAFSLKQKEELGEQKAAHFTYFINPVYLMTRANGAKYYRAPGKKMGQSNIGWGDNDIDIETRIEHMNDAVHEGHEIGNHTVGHFDGSKWSEVDWTFEFSQFYQMLDNLFNWTTVRKSQKYPQGITFKDQIVGFRAPLLGVSNGLWPTLAKFGYKYDTSKVNYENYWPKKFSVNVEGASGKEVKEIWNFPLAEIQEPGSSLNWISMDYNFCVRDSARVLAKDPNVMSLTMIDGIRKKIVKNTATDCLKVISEKQKQAVKANMLRLYHSYFNKNYYGNRAPIHIGHHFSNWMSGAYYEAFFEFAQEVCRKPEVKCGTYTELVDFLNKKTPVEVASYQSGKFAKLARPKALTMERHWDLNMSVSVKNDSLTVVLSGADAKKDGLEKAISIGGVTQKIGDEVKLEDIRKLVKTGETGFVRIAVSHKGKEINTATYQIDNVGTENESVNTENIETRWMEGHLPGAHADEAEVDFTQGH